MPSTSQLTTIGVWTAAIGFLGLLVRQIVPWKKVTSDADANLRDALIARVERLEQKLERQEARHVAETALGNHKLRNIQAAFDAMLLMLEMNPDRGPEIVAKIKEMRAAQMLAEAKEAAVIRAAAISAGDADEELSAGDE